ncbi:uncharacterized protein LOC114533613 [Dendronephthya gigantea]|uniref:uncharacterized protein LOC114533613 n=1 Tax=Dendronephthya gigantea TaxID=151771 RepID=UPI00106A3D81|nr:uncharacterized protein LOC114533613 [Dendronephthya gigantea]
MAERTEVTNVTVGDIFHATPLIKWTSAYTKLLISIRKENEKLFNTGRSRKKVIWARVAEKFNEEIDDVYTTGDQCQSKWKKLEQKYKDVKLHNSQSGNNRKEWEFYDLMDDVIGNNPNVVPVCTMSTIGDEKDTIGIEDEDDKEVQEGSKKKKKRRGSSTSTAVVEFLSGYATENKSNEREKMDMLQKMHDDKMDIMNRFLTLMERQHHV